jgi:uncharacterized protein
MSTATEVVLDVFRAIEHRDDEQLIGLCQPDVEFLFPPSLPYGRARASLQEEIGSRGAKPSQGTPTWRETWEPLQPDDGSRRMDPEVVGVNGTRVVVLWHQRGADPAGRRIDEQVVGLYDIVDGKLARGQMFYFDPTVVEDFLAAAAGG